MSQVVVSLGLNQLGICCKFGCSSLSNNWVKSLACNSWLRRKARDSLAQACSSWLSDHSKPATLQRLAQCLTRSDPARQVRLGIKKRSRPQGASWHQEAIPPARCVLGSRSASTDMKTAVVLRWLALGSLTLLLEYHF
jgi:hypothetical protein